MKRLALSLMLLGAVVAFCAGNFRSADAIPRQPNSLISHRGAVIAHHYDDFRPIEEALARHQKETEKASLHGITAQQDRVMVGGKYLAEIPYFEAEPGSIRVKRRIDEQGKPTRDIVVSYNHLGKNAFFTINNASMVDGLYFPAGEKTQWVNPAKKRAGIKKTILGKDCYVVLTGKIGTAEISKVIEEIRGKKEQEIAQK